MSINSVLKRIYIRQHLQTKGSNPHFVREKVSKYYQTITVNFPGPQTIRQIIYALKVVSVLVNKTKDLF